MAQKIIIGLGNSPKKFEGTRHNFGFEVIDGFTDKYNLNYDRLDETALLARSRHSSLLRNKLDENIVLSKPFSFMNKIGSKIKKILNKLEIDSDNMLVVYDDIDLDLGRIRFRPDGSAGGHKGVQSIIQSLGTSSFPRLKLGIGPQGQLKAEQFVLQSFIEEELDLKNKVIDTACEAILDYCNKDFNQVMSKYNGINHQQEKQLNIK